MFPRRATTGLLSSLLTRRIDKVLIAATKADHLHHESHDRLEAITRRLVAAPSNASACPAPAST